MTDKVLALFVAALGDPEEPFSNEIEEIAERATNCLRKILQSVSIDGGGINKSDKLRESISRVKQI